MSNFELAKNFFLEGLSDLENRRYEAAETKLRRSLELLPDRVSTLTNLSAALIRQQKYAEAEFFLRKIISLDPGAAEAWLNLGLIEADIKNNHQMAVGMFESALRINPAYAAAWVNLGLACRRLQVLDKAAECYDQAIVAAPDLAEAHACRGRLRSERGDKTQALADLKTAYALNPEADYLLGDLLLAKAAVCDWDGMDELTTHLVAGIEIGARRTPPFNFLSLVDLPSVQKKVAQTWVQDKIQGPQY